MPDAAAQSMARQRTEVIGLVSIESRGPDTDIEQEGLLFIEEVLRGVELVLSGVGWSVLISVLRASDRPGAFRQLQKISAKVDGLLISEGIVDSAQIAQLAARVPVTLVAGSLDEPHADVVDADNRGGSVALARHLVEQHGLTRLFYIAGPPEAPDAQERRSAFEDTVAGYPGAAITRYFEGRFAAVSGQLAVRELLAAPQRTLPDAIVCGNDRWHWGPCGTAGRGNPGAGRHRRGGLRRHSCRSLLTPPLTTVRQPMRLLGERACSLLLERLADRPCRARRSGCRPSSSSGKAAAARRSFPGGVPEG